MKHWSRSTQNYSTPSRLRCINARRLETALRGSPSQRHQVPHTRYGQPVPISPTRQCYIRYSIRSPTIATIQEFLNAFGNTPIFNSATQAACHQQNPDDNANPTKLFSPTMGNTRSWVEPQTASVFPVPLHGARYIQVHIFQTYASRKSDSLAKC
ncbi:hypothetical protein PENSPDRAFT_142858 [Peniophora sp. CONT]|nr:hypothetical protein PENSPDRAFT_142858 [Peniophora sp. CONT]